MEWDMRGYGVVGKRGSKTMGEGMWGFGVPTWGDGRLRWGEAGGGAVRSPPRRPPASRERYDPVPAARWPGGRLCGAELSSTSGGDAPGGAAPRWAERDRAGPGPENGSRGPGRAERGGGDGSDGER